MIYVSLNRNQKSKECNRNKTEERLQQKRVKWTDQNSTFQANKTENVNVICGFKISLEEDLHQNEFDSHSLTVMPLKVKQPAQTQQYFSDERCKINGSNSKQYLLLKKKVAHVENEFTKFLAAIVQTFEIFRFSRSIHFGNVLIVIIFF